MRTIVTNDITVVPVNQVCTSGGSQNHPVFVNTSANHCTLHTVAKCMAYTFLVCVQMGIHGTI